MDMYREQILDHYKNPRGKGLLAFADGQAEEYNQVCGDRVQVQLDFADGKIAAMRFDGHGCAISQACASLLSEDIVGKNRSELAGLGLSDIEELVGFSLSPTRAKCALLPLQAAQSASKNK
ncbi:MAG: iron-sulfur cluster assembly scaffold protein [Candidatus Andersenbacteria bacterium]|nr:iron-sulfur cluster assembly scaffold protein [Candidatus Andersenbacteria bacterium]